MATWRDGPEYAPLERPAAFVVPDAPPIPDPDADAPAATAASAAPPDVEPTFSAPVGEQPALAALVPSAAPGRNPHLPFDVLTATVMNASSWSSGKALSGQEAAEQRSPQLPFNAPGPSLTGYLPVQPTVQPSAQINPAPFPAPGTTQWFAPPPDSRVPDAPPAVTIAQIWKAAGAGVMIPLIIGTFLPWLSILMLAISFTLSARIPYRRTAIRRAYFTAMIVMGVLALMSMMSTGYDSDVLFESLSSSAQMACLILPVVIGLIVGGALRAGESPDRIS